jgi:hypothetical protein
MSKTNSAEIKNHITPDSEPLLNSYSSININNEEMKRKMLESLEDSKKLFQALHRNHRSNLPNLFDMGIESFLEQIDGYIHGMKLIESAIPKGGRPEKKQEYLIALSLMQEYFQPDLTEKKKRYPSLKLFLRMYDKKIDELNASGNKNVGRISEKTAEIWLAHFKKPIPIKSPKK